MVTALFQALATGLSIWESTEKRKYLDRLMGLERDYYAEFNKDPSQRSDAVLDNIERELLILNNAFSSSVRAKDTQDKP